jgi:putative DNA primase/helicase
VNWRAARQRLAEAAAADPAAAYRRAGYASELRRTGNHLVGVCPFHAENTGSFKITCQGEHAGEWYCHGACGEGGDLLKFWRKLHGRTGRATVEEIAELFAILGLGDPDTDTGPARGSAKPPGRVIAQRAWELKDAQGRVIAVHHRRDYAGGEKGLWWERDGKKGLGGLRVASLPLYRLPELLAADVKKPVVVTEGEKACDALTAAGALAVGTVCGASVTPNAAVLKHLAGRPVYLWPDADEVGRRHMLGIAKRLAKAGRAPKVIAWPEAPEHGDAADFFAEGKTAKDLRALLATATEADLSEPDAGAEVLADDRFTDVGNGRRLVALFGEDLRYCEGMGCWFAWDGRRWRREADHAARERAKATAESILREAGETQDKTEKAALAKHGAKSLSERSLKAMLWCAQSDERIAVEADAFDADPWALNVLNGTIHLRTGELREHRRGDLLTKVAPVDYDPERRWDLWEDFLDRLTEYDQDLRHFLQRVAGYALTGSTREEKFFFVYGATRSGKSTLLNALQSAWGDYAQTVQFDSLLRRPAGGGPRDDLAALQGVRLAVTIETEEGAKLAEGLVKQLTGGDRLRARRLYANSVEFRPTAKFVLSANVRPRVRDDDAAIWRRLTVVECPHSIPEDEADPQYKELLCDPSVSGQAILAWAVRGCLDWQAGGLQVPSSVRSASDRYRESQNPLADFLEACCVLTPAAWTSSAALTAAYKQWAEEVGLRMPLSPVALARRLEAAGCQGERRGRPQQRGWLGLGLRDEAGAGELPM